MKNHRENNMHIVVHVYCEKVSNSVKKAAASSDEKLIMSSNTRYNDVFIKAVNIRR